MVLIGISGSSKCDWQLIENTQSVEAFSTGGLNPMFHSEDDIYILLKELEPIKGKSIDAIYIYSAGCGSKKFQNIVVRACSRAFPKSNYYVNHDIVASALATYEGIPSIACILGTGSNACYFDGDIVRQNTPALDYVLGDEGSGSNFGKQLLHAYLHNTLPEDLAVKITEYYQLSREEILENVYMKPYPNVYLASFMTFIQENRQHPYFQKILRQGFSNFMDYYLLTLPKFDSLITHFTGSIAYFFADELKDVAKEKGVKVGKIIKEPIDTLVQYHIKKSIKL